jgi:hypothetical protein
MIRFRELRRMLPAEDKPRFVSMVESIEGDEAIRNKFESARRSVSEVNSEDPRLHDYSTWDAVSHDASGGD